jgi:hypothetical protein
MRSRIGLKRKRRSSFSNSGHRGERGVHGKEAVRSARRSRVFLTDTGRFAPQVLHSGTFLQESGKPVYQENVEITRQIAQSENDLKVDADGAGQRRTANRAVFRDTSGLPARRLLTRQCPFAGFWWTISGKPWSPFGGADYRISIILMPRSTFSHSWSAVRAGALARAAVARQARSAKEKSKSRVAGRNEAAVRAWAGSNGTGVSCKE